LPGCDADLCVLDLAATPLQAFRMKHVKGIDEALAVLMALGDDRSVRATYVAGRCVWKRDAR
ncbi:MAG TPA: guanine deaminase, partial [Casimicrobiaceae bacterium]|nr:guanine deaminase [Casimicrobiaceae bacterium]